jgi:hypothetical protein
MVRGLSTGVCQASTAALVQAASISAAAGALPEASDREANFMPQASSAMAPFPARYGWHDPQEYRRRPVVSPLPRRACWSNAGE